MSSSGALIRLRDGSQSPEYLLAKPEIITPGSHLPINIEFGAVGNGPRSGNLVVECDDPSRRSASVLLRGVVTGRPRVHIAPEQIEFGRVRSSPPPCDVSVMSIGGSGLDLRPVRLEEEGAFEIQQMPEQDVLPPGGELRFKIALLARRRGEYQTMMRVVTNDPVSPTVRVRVHAVCE